MVDNKELKVLCLWLMGYCEEFQFKKLNAFRHYTDALYLAREMNKPLLLIRCYEQLFDFYYEINNYEKAEDYVYRTMPVLMSSSVVDSVGLMHQLSNLLTLQCSMREYDAAVRTAGYVINYSNRTGASLLKKPVLATMKSVFIEHGEYKRLKAFFTQYPGELSAVAFMDPAPYYQLKAAFAEADGLPDTADKYYQLIQAEIFARPKSAGANAFYLRRYGKFLLHWGRPATAITIMDSALKYAMKAEYFPYMEELTRQLDSIYALMGDSAAAYRYAKLNKQYAEKLALATRQDEILAMDLENEIRTRELLAQREETETKRRHNIQYMAITLLIGVCFGLLVMIGVFPVPHWLITAASFFSFIFLFEFIILVIDHQLLIITHGEPWKMLSIKIVIIAGLTPLHHWLEHKLVHYLNHHTFTISLRKKITPVVQKVRRISRLPQRPRVAATKEKKPVIPAEKVPTPSVPAAPTE